MTMRFTGKSALVTGAGSGIGRAVARLLADEGAKVLAADLSDGVQETAAGYPSIAPMRGNAGSEKDVTAMIEAAVSQHGGLDIVIANAGVTGGYGGLFDLSSQDWADLLQVNLIGPFLAIKHGAHWMHQAKRPGAIVCTASVAGLRAGAGGPAYSASKAGVINLVQIAAQQLSGTGIRVNAVCPGLIETGMTKPIYDRAREKGREDALGQLCPLLRGGQPEEIASVMAFLVSEDASYLNGQAIVVDGGLSSSLPVSRPPQVGRSSF